MAQQNDATEETESTTRKTPIYAHMAADGLAFCTYGVDFEELEAREIDIERIESAFYSVEGSDDIIENLTVEGVREQEGEDPPQVGTLTFSDAGIENIDISLPALGVEYERDSDGWPARDSDVPCGLANVRAVFVLAGNTVIYEDGEGPARANRIGAQDWYGPDLKYDPYNDGKDAVATYSVETGTGTVAIRESDVERIQTPDGEEVGNER